MPVMLKEVVPTLVRVTFFAPLIVPMACVENVKLTGESLAVVPIPLSVTFCGLPAALSLMLTAAVRVPLAVGLKVTLIPQLAPAANELPQVWVCAKFPALVPVIAMLLMVKIAVPVFLSVTVLAVLVVPIACVEKVRLVGDKVAFGPEIAAAPLNVTLCGVPRNRPK